MLSRLGYGFLYLFLALCSAFGSFLMYTVSVMAYSDYQRDKTVLWRKEDVPLDLAFVTFGGLLAFVSATLAILCLVWSVRVFADKD